MFTGERGVLIWKETARKGAQFLVWFSLAAGLLSVAEAHADLAIRGGESEEQSSVDYQSVEVYEPTVYRYPFSQEEGARIAGAVLNPITGEQLDVSVQKEVVKTGEGWRVNLVLQGEGAINVLEGQVDFTENEGELVELGDLVGEKVEVVANTLLEPQEISFQQGSTIGGAWDSLSGKPPLFGGGISVLQAEDGRFAVLYEYHVRSGNGAGEFIQVYCSEIIEGGGCVIRSIFDPMSQGVSGVLREVGSIPSLILETDDHEWPVPSEPINGQAGIGNLKGGVFPVGL